MSSRALRVTVIVVVAVVALLVVLDRVGRYIAERVAADTIQSSQDLNSRPDVNIAGFPFLNQFATGKYDKVTVTADDVPVGLQARQLVVSRVRVVLRSLTVSRDFNQLHAARADATATITYSELGDTLGVNVSYAGDGRIRASQAFTVAGVRVTAAATARPRVSDGALSFSDPEIGGPRVLDATVAAALRGLFDVTIPLNGARFGIEVRSVRAGPDGVTAALTGRDLTYSQ